MQNMADNHRDEKTIKTSNKFFYLISLIGFFGIFSTTISKTPVLPLLVKNGLGGSDATLGLISFFSPLAGMLFSFPIGVLLDRLGFKKLMRASAFFFCAAPLGYLFISNPWWLIPLRFFHGFATAILGPAAAAAISRIYFADKGKKLGLYSSATLIGRTIAPTIGGFVIALAAAQGLAPLLTYKTVYLIAFCASLPILFFIPSLDYPNSKSNNQNNGRLKFNDFNAGLKYFFGNKILFSTGLVEMTIYFAYGIVETFLPVYMQNNGFRAGTIGLIFSLQVIILAFFKPIFGHLSDIVDKRLQIIIGLTFTAVAIYLIIYRPNIWFIVIGSIIFGLGMAIATSATSVYAADIAQTDKLGGVMGALSSIMDVGQSFGPLIAGGIATAMASVSAGFMAIPILCLLTGIFFVAANFLHYSFKTISAIKIL